MCPRVKGSASGITKLANMNIDRIVTSKHIYTGENQGAQTKPLAFAISGETIVWIGPISQLSTYLQTLPLEDQACVPIEDYGEAFIAPGFHDSHLHFFHSALYASPLATQYRGTDEQDCVAHVQKFAQSRPEGWILAQGWRHTNWPSGKMPTKASLDAVFPDRPVAYYSGDAHTLWLNSYALQELGITAASVAPQGGYYERDEQGNLTGIVGEVAAMELMPTIVGAFSEDELLDAYRNFLAILAQNGITSVCDMSLMASPGLDFVRDDLYQKLLERGELTARVHMFPTLLNDQERFDAMEKTYTTSRLQVRGFKQFFDGVSSKHTAWLKEPYTSEPHDCGRPSVDPDIMRQRVLSAAQRHRPVRIHTIGDEAIHVALDIFEEARQLYGPLPEPCFNCLEHMENFQPEDMTRLSELQVIAAVQPPHITLDPGSPEADLGPERVPYMWPFKTLLQNGTKLAFGTDSPVVPPNSLDVLYVAITRQHPLTHKPQGGWLPQECLTPEEALSAYTYGSAQAAGRGHELGKLAVGYLADFVVLDKDILSIPSDQLQNAHVIATYVGGQCVYRSEDGESCANSAAVARA